METRRRNFSHIKFKGLQTSTTSLSISSDKVTKVGIFKLKCHNSMRWTTKVNSFITSNRPHLTKVTTWMTISSKDNKIFSKVLISIKTKSLHYLMSLKQAQKKPSSSEKEGAGAFQNRSISQPAPDSQCAPLSNSTWHLSRSISKTTTTWENTIDKENNSKKNWATQLLNRWKEKISECSCRNCKAK